MTQIEVRVHFLYRRNSLTAIETYCRLARLRYAGHIGRMSKSRIPNIVLHGEVGEGFRRPGRPKKSFREGLRNDLKAFQLWPKCTAQIFFDRLVEDRKEWRKTINSAAQKIQEQWEQTKIDTSNERKQAKK